MKKTFETFKEISDYTIDSLIKNKPSSFNGNIQIKKYRITIEEIEEAREIYIERLQNLWDYCDNWHHWKPLENAARKIGYELENPAGTKINKTKS